MVRVPEILLCNSTVNKQLYFSLINMINHQSQHSNAHLGIFFFLPVCSVALGAPDSLGALFILLISSSMESLLFFRRNYSFFDYQDPLPTRSLSCGEGNNTFSHGWLCMILRWYSHFRPLIVATEETRPHSGQWPRPYNTSCKTALQRCKGLSVSWCGIKRLQEAVRTSISRQWSMQAKSRKLCTHYRIYLCLLV